MRVVFFQVLGPEQASKFSIKIERVEKTQDIVSKLCSINSSTKGAHAHSILPLPLLFVNLDPELFCACGGERSRARIPKPVSTGIENVPFVSFVGIKVA